MPLLPEDGAIGNLGKPHNALPKERSLAPALPLFRISLASFNFLIILINFDFDFN